MTSKRPKPFTQQFGGLTITNRTGVPITEQELLEGLAAAQQELRSRPKRGPRKASTKPDAQGDAA